MNFSGNIEGRDILKGKVDAVVCDGFVGNVVLKLAEGVSEVFRRGLKNELRRSLGGRLAMLTGLRAFRRFSEKYDHQAYGGAPILGINGVAIVCHGGASEVEIGNAVKMAARYASGKVPWKTAAAFASFGRSGNLQ